MKEVSFRIKYEMEDKKSSKLLRYQNLIIGSKSLVFLLKYELIIFFSSWIPGALGLFLRSKLYPLLIKKCGKGVVFGQNVLLRHPKKIEIGDNVIIDDNCMLDAKGDTNSGIKLGNGVFIGRNTILSSKNGDITLEDNVNIGFNCNIFSGSNIFIGKNTLIAAYCYLIGGDHGITDIEKNFYDQKSTSKGIILNENCWLGASVKVQDGVKIGANSLIGTLSLVTKDIPDYSIAVGIPAKVIKDRRLNSN